MKILGNCLYVGGVYTETEILRNSAVSPAGDRWQRGLLRALEKHCEQVEILSHQQERIFPFGAAFPPAPSLDYDQSRIIPVSYQNVPLLRRESLTSGYVSALDKAMNRPNAPQFVICYNASPWTCALAKRAKTYYQIPAIGLHLDFGELTDGWDKLADCCERFTANVFASYCAYVHVPAKNKFHLDGGFTRKRVLNERKSGTHEIVYAGNISKSKGVDKLVSCFKKMENERAKLVLFGKIDLRNGGTVILRECESDRRIEYRGVVPKDSLESVLSNAAALVNPVSEHTRENPLNFPSKVHHYLEMGPPIVSALVEGMHPKYRDLIYCVNNDADMNEWTSCIAKALAETDRTRSIRTQKANSFLDSHQWDVQVKNLLVWSQSLSTNPAHNGLLETR